SVDPLDSLRIAGEATTVQLEEVRELSLGNGDAALLGGAHVAPDVLAEAGEHAVEIGKIRKSPRVVRRLPEPMPAQRRPVVERGVAARLQVSEPADPLQQRLDERDLSRPAARTLT